MTEHPIRILDDNFNPFAALAEKVHQMKEVFRIRQTAERSHILALFTKINAFPAHVEASLYRLEFLKSAAARAAG